MRESSSLCTICLTEIQPYSPAVKLQFDQLPAQEYLVCMSCDNACGDKHGYTICLEKMAVARAKDGPMSKSRLKRLEIMQGAK